MKRLLALLSLGLLALPTFAAGSTPTPIAGYTAVKTVGGIAEYTLDANGLGVLLLEDHSAPVLTFMVTFRVGSRNEVTGTTGATHILEHLMFKGSRNFHAGIGKSFDTMMDRVGGINNASTWLDRTNYYENLPSNQLELAVQMEADRMRGLLLRDEDRQPEMTVVRNEFERGENDPSEALDKEVMAAAFLAHPYHHSTIGWRSDIEKVSIGKLREFYDTFYWPNNATVTVIGDFQPAQALALVQQYFGAIPRSPHPIPTVYTEEPPQTGARRVSVRRPGEVGAIEIAFKAPRSLDDDQEPLDVLATILGDGKSSRLYRALIDRNLAIHASAAKGFFADPNLFTLNALLAPGVTHEKVEQTLLAEIARVKTEGVTAEEVSRAVNQILASVAYRRDGSFAIAGEINECIAIGDWTYYVRGPERIKTVTAADVLRVAKKYLNEDQSTTGWFIPLPGEAAAAVGRRRGGDTAAATPATVVPARAPRHPVFYRDPATTAATDPARFARAEAGAAAGAAGESAAIAPRVHRRQVAGLDVLTLPTSIRDVVTIRGALSGGDVFNPPENPAIADLTAAMLDKGTAAHDKFALAALLEQAGATLSFSTGTHTLNFAGKCLRQDLPLVLGLLAEQLRTPRFDADEFAKLKKQLVGRYKRALEDTNFRAELAFERAIFPAGHPNRPAEAAAYLAAVEAATLDQVKAFHAANYGPAAFRIVLVGDVDDATVDQTLTKGFTGWQGGKALPAMAKASLPVSAGEQVVAMPGKTSVTYVIGQPSTLRYADPDYPALNFATSVLGSGFFSARLLDTIRNKEGLTYGIGARLANDTFADGSWYIEGTFGPTLLAQGASSTERELRKFHAEGITADELKNFKVTLTGTYKVTLSTTGGLAAVLLNALQRGYGPEWVDEYPRRIEALTLEQVNGAIRKYLHPDRMVRVMAGTMPAKDTAK
ncbi:pitrilysin family protein [Opitutus sp. ER46]|uniref:M16 family metallopeptidase n=1 Tax=Opitutus sp. ER46 TaxID=2161864 RepID=UPI000D30AEF3|nr:pitrilysin family protein [Opitutus sp. ER46]PTX97840.1 insulinase family protein [Opitutus sp. ER46]